MEGAPVWHGALRVRGHREDLLVRVAAARYTTDDRPQLLPTTAAEWPPELLCASSMIRACASVRPHVYHPDTQWYVRFVPVDHSGTPVAEPRLAQLVSVMVHRQYAFVVPCANGTLFLWGMPVDDTPTMLGVFRPSTPSSQTPNMTATATAATPLNNNARPNPIPTHTGNPNPPTIAINPAAISLPDSASNAAAAAALSPGALGTLPNPADGSDRVSTNAAAAVGVVGGGGVPWTNNVPSPALSAPDTMSSTSPSWATEAAVKPEEMDNSTIGVGNTPSSSSQLGGGGDRVWSGVLHVRGHRNDMAVACVGVRYSTVSRTEISIPSVQSWPAQIQCDSSKLKQCQDLYDYINHPASQWYIRFAAVDSTHNEIAHPKLAQLAKVMISRSLAFEIEFGDIGTLYIWGMPLPPFGTSLLGVYRPN